MATAFSTTLAKPTMVSPRTRASGRPSIPAATTFIKAVALLLFLALVVLWKEFRPDVDYLHPAAQTAATSTSDGDGFHPIHVYYGPEDAVKGLRSSSSEMQQTYNAGSQVDQDKIIIALTKLYRSKNMQKSNGASEPYFIDLAANDAIQLSNTLRLEDDGWRGLCVEPNPIYWYRLAHRKCDVVGAFVGGQTDMQQVDVSLTNEEYGGIVGDQMDNKKNVGKKNRNNMPEMEKRYTVSLRSIFRKFDVPPTIDYMSLDVEGAEELIMEDFPYDAHKILFITIERPKPGLKTLLEANGYRFVMMLIVWGETLWVHESVLDDLSMSEIEQTVRSTSDYPGRKPRKGQMVFNIETGEYLKNER